MVDEQHQRRSVRVAIVGSGLTGLSAAYLLTNDLKQQSPASSTPPPDVKVELFERAPRLGMDASSISVTDPSSQKSLRIDVPMRAFNAGYYPELLTLYRRINITGEPSNFSYSFGTASASAASAAQSANTSSNTVRVPPPSFIYLGSSGAKGARMPTALRRTLPTFRMLDARRAWIAVASLTTYWGILSLYFVGYMHFLFLSFYHSWFGHTRDPSHRLATLTLAEWVRASWVPSAFMDDILIPILSATQTAPASAIWQTPCAEVLEFTALNFGANTFRVSTGVHSVVTALTSRMQPGDLHLSSTILEMRPSPTKPGAVLFKVAQSQESVDGEQQREPVVREFDGYDYVIFGLQANQTVQILREYEKLLAADRSTTFDAGMQKQRSHLREMIAQLEEFPYERSVVINHTDTRMLPPEEDRCDLNMISPPHRSSRVRSDVAPPPHQNGGGCNGTDDEEDEGTVDRLLAGHSDGNGVTSNGTGNGKLASEYASFSYDPSLLAPEGCTMVTHLIKHYTRPIASSSSASPNPDSVSASPESKFPDLPILAHGRQGSNGHTRESGGCGPEHAAARSIDDVHGEPGTASNGVVPPHPSNGSARSSSGEEESVLFMQTTNPLAPYLPRPELTLSISHFERVVLTIRAKAAQGRFFKWVKVDLAKQRRPVTPSHGQALKGHDGKQDAGRFFLPTAARFLSALLPTASRTQWKVELGDLQQGGQKRSSGPGLLMAGSWGPPAIPLLEGCVTSARLAVSEVLRREGLCSDVCEELAANAM
ncbi:hypothetical protein CF327_g5667 [Tilletia walkeri]|nr:hypothetical protein CF327_g5667 [Tilletia walkeri]